MRIDAGDVNKPIGIKNPQPPIMEFDDAVLLEVAQNPVDVDSRETRRVPDMLLVRRQGFWDKWRGELTEALAHQDCHFRLLPAGAASGDA